jgi:hypothetical protein
MKNDTFLKTTGYPKIPIVKDQFPNGLEDYLEAHYEIVAEIERQLMRDDEAQPEVIRNTYESMGHWGMYELAKRWADEFSVRERGEDVCFSDAMEEFMSEVLRDLEGERAIATLMGSKTKLLGVVFGSPELRGEEVRICLGCESESIDSIGDKIYEVVFHTLFSRDKRQNELILNHVREGDRIAVEGFIINCNSLDANGNKRYDTYIQIEEMMMLGYKKSN